MCTDEIIIISIVQKLNLILRRLPSHLNAVASLYLPLSLSAVRLLLCLDAFPFHVIRVLQNEKGGKYHACLENWVY